MIGFKTRRRVRFRLARQLCDLLTIMRVALAKTQNLLVTEKRTAQQLRSYTNQMETDLQNQTKILNDLLVKHKELEDKSKRQVR